MESQILMTDIISKSSSQPFLDQEKVSLALHVSKFAIGVKRRGKVMECLYY